MTTLLVDATGWLGAGALLTAYFLVSTRRVSGDDLAFQLLNLSGGAGLLINGVYHGAWPSAGLNTVWVVIGLAAITRARRTHPPGPPPEPGSPALSEADRSNTGRTAAGQRGRRTSFTSTRDDLQEHA